LLLVAGVVAIQASAAGPTPPASWRIAATAVVLEQEAELRIVKKLKLVGTPLKVSCSQLKVSQVQQSGCLFEAGRSMPA
jgi:hypothetical protein